MTLTLTLPPELEQYLYQQAKQHGLSVEAVTLQLLSESILSRQKESEAADILQTWIDDKDVAEQKETGNYLIQALDEDRLSERQLFPLDMKGVTW